MGKIRLPVLQIDFISIYSCLICTRRYMKGSAKAGFPPPGSPDHRRRIKTLKKNKKNPVMVSSFKLGGDITGNHHMFCRMHCAAGVLQKDLSRMYHTKPRDTEPPQDVCRAARSGFARRLRPGRPQKAVRPFSVFSSIFANSFVRYRMNGSVAMAKSTNSMTHSFEI